MHRLHENFEDYVNTADDVEFLYARDLEVLLGYPVYLELWVKVRKNWRKSPVDLRRFGYHKER